MIFDIDDPFDFSALGDLDEDGILDQAEWRFIDTDGEGPDIHSGNLRLEGSTVPLHIEGPFADIDGDGRPDGFAGGTDLDAPFRDVDPDGLDEELLLQHYARMELTNPFFRH